MKSKQTEPKPKKLKYLVIADLNKEQFKIKRKKGDIAKIKTIEWSDLNEIEIELLGKWSIERQKHYKKRQNKNKSTGSRHNDKIQRKNIKKEIKAHN